MSTVPAPASTAEAVDMVLAGLSYLAAADPTVLAAQAQAECLQTLEQADAIATAARARILAAFTAGQGYAADADCSPAAWLIHRTKVTKGAARGHLGWARRAAAHPQVLAALAGETVLTESMARLICGWTDRLPASCRERADDILLVAARAGARIEDLAALAAEIYARSLPEDQEDSDLLPSFGDRQVRVETTFGGAGVIAGDLTPECAAVVTAVLEALSAPAGAEDTRTKDQRYHDALEDAMRRLVASGLLPERAGQPVKVWAHVSLAELRALDDGSVLAQEWAGEMAVRWAARRAAASQAGSDGAAWLDGQPARAMACDASVIPVVTGGIDPAALDELVSLCLQFAGHGPHCGARPNAGPSSPGRRQARLVRLTRPRARTLLTGQASPAAPALPARKASPRTRRPRTRPVSQARPRAQGRAATRPYPFRGPRPPRPRRCSGTRSSAGPPTWSPAPAGWPASCGPGCWAPGWPGPPCRWTSGAAPRSPPPSAARSSCATSTAAGQAGSLSAGEELWAARTSSGAKATRTVLESLAAEAGMRWLSHAETGDPSGVAWTEAGQVDHFGHDLGAQLVDEIDQEIDRIALRVRQLLKLGGSRSMSSPTTAGSSCPAAWKRSTCRWRWLRRRKAAARV